MNIVKVAVICCLFLLFATGFSAETKSAEASGKCRIPSAEEAYKDSKAVFVGEVTSIVKNGDVKTFIFEIEKYWKGAASKLVEINAQETMRYQAWFEVGETYLVYARGDGAEGGKLWEVRCSRSKALADASEDISKFRRAKEPVKNNSN